MGTVLERGRSSGTLLVGVLLVLAAGCLLASSPVAADDPGAGEVNISVEPSETTLEPAETTTYEIVVEGAQEGIHGYAHLDIVIENPDVAQFVDFYETAEGNDEENLSFTLTEIQDADGNASEEGPVFSMEAALPGDAAFEGAEEIVIAEVDVEVLGSVPSATGVSIVENPDPEGTDEPEVGKNENGDAYDVHALRDSDLTVPAAANLSVEPTGDEPLPGGTMTYELVVEGAEYGIQSYEGIEVVLGNSDTAQFVDFSETAEDNVDPGGEPPVSDSEIRDADGNPAETGSVLYLDADLAGGAFDGASEIVLAEVEAEVTGVTPTAVTVAEAGLRDLEGVDYEVTNTTGAILDPIGLDVTGDGNPATDTTGDGLLNDIDGDGAFDVFDVQALFNNLDGAVVQDNPAMFDFDADDPPAVDIFDVQALFDDLGAGT